MHDGPHTGYSRDLNGIVGIHVLLHPLNIPFIIGKVTHVGPEQLPDAFLEVSPVAFGFPFGDWNEEREGPNERFQLLEVQVSVLGRNRDGVGHGRGAAVANKTANT